LLGVREGKKFIQDFSTKTGYKRQRGRQRRPWEEYIEMDIKEIENECMGWSHLVGYWDQWLLWIEHGTLKSPINGAMFLDHKPTINFTRMIVYLEF
jgi:hypothetical protein